MTEPTVRTLTAEQSLRVLGVRRTVHAGSRADDVLRDAAARLAAILDAAVAFAGRRHGRWSVVARSTRGSDAALFFDDPRLLDETAERPAPAVSVHSIDGAPWTSVSLPVSPRAVLMIEGDWSPSSDGLADAARALCAPPRAATHSGHLGLAAYDLARDLAAAANLRGVCELTVRAVVRALPCRVATFAVPTEQGSLSIVATHGYPVALAEHLRIAPGAGIIGGVYQRGVPLRVDDVTALPGFERPRARYRTKSFAALPITAGADVLGVLCVTDRDGDVALSVDDVADLGMLLAPVALALVRERTQRQADVYAQAAVVDPASGLFNRPYFQSRLQEELQRSTRQSTPVSLFMLDIDSFKNINDTYGHLAGDAVIKDVADIIRSSVRVFDVCARYGGEEFAVVMPGTDLERAAAIAERIRHRIQSYHSADHALAGVRVTASIGVAESGGMAGMRELIEQADAALYAAKRAGKNRVSTRSRD
jgi:diguanylate cyclase (GGDEF)-like protein